MLINFMNEFLADTEFKDIMPKIFQILNDFSTEVTKKIPGLKFEVDSE